MFISLISTYRFVWSRIGAEVIYSSPKIELATVRPANGSDFNGLKPTVSDLLSDLFAIQIES